jgi:hypothetical protein
MKETVGSEDSKQSILKKMGFRYKRCNDGGKKKILMEHIIGARSAFLYKMHELIQKAELSFFAVP